MITVPRIKRYAICVIKRKSGVSSGYLNLPQEFLRELQRRRVKSLVVLYDSILGAFPDAGSGTERALLTFFQKHAELQKLFVQKGTEVSEHAGAVCE
jgi:hypothetical protein